MSRWSKICWNFDCQKNETLSMCWTNQAKLIHRHRHVNTKLKVSVFSSTPKLCSIRHFMEVLMHNYCNILCHPVSLYDIEICDTPDSRMEMPLVSTSDPSILTGFYCDKTIKMAIFLHFMTSQLVLALPCVKFTYYTFFH